MPTRMSTQDSKLVLNLILSPGITQRLILFSFDLLNQLKQLVSIDSDMTEVVRTAGLLFAHLISKYLINKSLRNAISNKC